jgi:hypothetical protein
VCIFPWSSAMSIRSLHDFSSLPPCMFRTSLFPDDRCVMMSGLITFRLAMHSGSAMKNRVVECLSVSKRANGSAGGRYARGGDTA